MKTDVMSSQLTDCKEARTAFDDPWQRLCDAVADEDQYEIDSLVRESVDALTELQDACGALSADCGQRRSASRADVRLIQRELTTLIRDLKSISKSGVEGEDLQDLMDEWNESFYEWDTSLDGVLDVIRQES